MDLATRFLKKITVDESTGCWLWTGAKSHNGYGQIRVDKHCHYAHRLAYEILVAPIPEGLDLDHLCRVRCCVNPWHLEPVTRKENLLRGPRSLRGKSHCPKGHPLSEETLYLTKRGHRRCRVCDRELKRASYRRRTV